MWHRGGFVFSVHSAFGVACQFGSLEAGGGSVPKMEESWGDWPRNGGFRSDPVAPRWFRIFCLFCVLGVACQFGSWRRVGRRQKCRADGEINAKMADCTRKSRNLPIRGDP